VNRPRFLGDKIIIKQSSLASTCAEILSGSKNQFFLAPVFVAGDDKGGDSRPHLFQVVEYAALDALFFIGPEDPFHHTISS
jgi:hypothetical protein